MILCDKDIRKRCVIRDEYYKELIPLHPMIDPFSEPVSGNGVISYGLTGGGYDIRLGTKFLFFKELQIGCYEDIDPKKFNDLEYRKNVFHEINVESGAVVLPPHSYCLGHSLERFCIPSDLQGTCVGKSTYARSGILINTTPLEPGWKGILTVEIGNISPRSARIYIGEGIAQVRFEVLSGIPEQDYAAKKGQYQDQVGVTPARVK